MSSSRSRTILSIDVGIKNLAYVLATVPASQESPMSVIDVACTDLTDSSPGSTIDQYTTRVVDFLTVKFPQPTPIDEVLVERQIVKNSRAFAISHVIFAYFHFIEIPKVVMCHAGKKTALPRGSGKSRRKRDSASIGPEVVASHFDDVSRARIREVAGSSPKKDDVYDAVLQLTHYASTTSGRRDDDDDATMT